MKKLLLTTTLLTIAAFPALAEVENGKGLSVQKRTVAEEQAYQYEFERDEQCQGYAFGVKKLGITDNCEKKEEPVIVEVPVVEEVIVEVPVVVEPVEVLKEYVVYFDFDKSAIRAVDQSVLNSVSAEI